MLCPPQVRVPGHPLPTAWGRTVQPYDPTRPGPRLLLARAPLPLSATLPPLGPAPPALPAPAPPPPALQGPRTPLCPVAEARACGTAGGEHLGPVPRPVPAPPPPAARLAPLRATGDPAALQPQEHQHSDGGAGQLPAAACAGGQQSGEGAEDGSSADKEARVAPEALGGMPAPPLPHAFGSTGVTASAAGGWLPVPPPPPLAHARSPPGVGVGGLQQERGSMLLAPPPPPVRLLDGLPLLELVPPPPPLAPSPPLQQEAWGAGAALDAALSAQGPGEPPAWAPLDEGGAGHGQRWQEAQQEQEQQMLELSSSREPSPAETAAGGGPGAGGAARPQACVAYLEVPDLAACDLRARLGAGRTFTVSVPCCAGLVVAARTTLHFRLIMTAHVGSGGRWHALPDPHDDHGDTPPRAVASVRGRVSASPDLAWPWCAGGAH